MKTKGIYFLYRVLQALALPLLILYFLFRGLRNRAYWRTLPQRFGFLPHSFKQTGPGAIWLHAVSMGEVLACMEFARRLRAEFPHSPLLVSVSTLAGHATAVEKLRTIFTETPEKRTADSVFYAPVDYVFAVRRVLRALRPSVVVVAETEIWPNWFREVNRTGAGLCIVNGRISDQALPKYLRFQWFFPAVLGAVDSILAQTDQMGGRFLALGAPVDRVRTGGNLKYDFDAREADAGSPVMQLLERVRPGKVWIAASTMPPSGAGDVDEDDVVIAAFRELAVRWPNLLLILVPRKPERFEPAAAKLAAAGVRFVRRSSLATGPDLALPHVLLLDSIGELGGLFGCADVVFMGGTLARRGGHNILEPAFFGKPVIVGPHMENFQAIAEEFRAAGALVEIGAAQELTAAVERLLQGPCGGIGQRARVCAEARRGATARAVAEVRALYRVPRYRPAMPWFLVARMLAAAWKSVARRRQVRDYARRRRLDVPVISVGNLTMGGTGKTPCVLRLVELLKARGHTPGILTRGYGRKSPVGHLVLAPGAAAPTEKCGDEPQIFIRSGLAPVGIGADRFLTGTLLRQDFHVDTILLDDGFQHLKLARNLDIVLIDALNPFGGGEVFPVGRLREPVAGLSRADVILITRSDVSDLGPVIERTVRRWNSRAPIFRARVEPEWWVEHRTGRQHRPESLAFEHAGVLCGLGNPQAFYRTLERMGVQPVDRVEFEDHHHYRPQELQRIAAHLRACGATAVITTQKDAVNLCVDCDDQLDPLPLYWLKVSMKIEGEGELLDEIERRIR